MTTSKLKSFVVQMILSNKVKRHIEWEIVFANHFSDTGFVPKIYKQQPQLNNKSTNYQSRNMQRISIEIINT